MRGNFNAAVDNATGDHASAAKHEAIASKGADEIDRGYHREHGTNAGVTPVDQDKTNTVQPSHEPEAPAPAIREPINPQVKSTTGRTLFKR